jgi:23S rRNA pseudouridine955/2504/2580 synthase
MICVHPAKVDATEGAKHATTDYAVLDALGARGLGGAGADHGADAPAARPYGRDRAPDHAGDGKYGGSGQENMGDGWGAMLGGEISRKLHLHARSIGFIHPITKAAVTITADLPEHMARTWATMGWIVNDAPADPFQGRK